MAAKERRLSGAVFTDKKGDRFQATTLLSLETAHIVYG